MLPQMYYPDTQRYSPVRLVSWRWERAQQLLAAGHRWTGRRDDAWTRQALNYLRAQQNAFWQPDGWLTRQFPVIDAAQLLHLDDQRRLETQARLLASQSASEIAERTALPAAVVDAYEALFFQVADRLGAQDWVIWHAIGHRDESQAILLRRLAYFGGPLVLDTVLPYLVGDRDPFAGTPDLTTLEGRIVQSLRFLLLVESLPRGAARPLQAARMHTEMLAQRAKLPLAAPIGTILARTVASALDDLTVMEPLSTTLHTDRGVPPAPAVVSRQLG